MPVLLIMFVYVFMCLLVSMIGPCKKKKFPVTLTGKIVLDRKSREICDFGVYFFKYLIFHPQKTKKLFKMVILCFFGTSAT